METFAMIFVTAFMIAMAIIILGGVFGCYDNYSNWKRKQGTEPVKRSAPSDNYLTEMENVIGVIRERLWVRPVVAEDDRKEFERLCDSSDIASLFRSAHNGGFHLTFEQNECEWEDDAEYCDEDVFKTDMKEAADMREQKRWQSYKRYYDPPRSLRDRRLGRNP